MYLLSKAINFVKNILFFLLREVRDGRKLNMCIRTNDEIARKELGPRGRDGKRFNFLGQVMSALIKLNEPAHTLQLEGSGEKKS